MLPFNVDSNDSTRDNLEHIMCDYGALGKRLKGVGADMAQSSVLPVKGKGLVEMDSSCRSTTGCMAGVTGRTSTAMTAGLFLRNKGH